MNVIGSFHADAALRLANERLDDYRTEARHNRFAAAAPKRESRLAGFRGALESFRSALTSVETDRSLGLPKLDDYPYRS